MKNKWIERFSLVNKTALVTGASKGIGKEICQVFAEAGCSLIALGRHEKNLYKLSKSILIINRNVLFSYYIIDLNFPSQINQTIRKILKQHNQIDIIVNAAGVALVDPIITLSEKKWDETMNVNLKAPFLIAKMIAPQMIKRKSGKIINISSQTGTQIATEEHSAYGASKGGLNALTQAMMAEWAPFNIQVNAICPTVILTPMGEKIWGGKKKSQPMIDKTPAKRFGLPIEVADLALYLASSASDLMNGECILLDGGFSKV